MAGPARERTGHRAREDERLNLPGEIVTIGGDRLHVVAEGDGTPPVLLSAGLGGAWFDWAEVTGALRDRHRAIAFDRPGLGGSPPIAARATLRGEADRLAALAVWAGGPVILVAHSYAGFHAEAFARLYPELVRGLVLVDPSCELEPPSHPRLFTRLAPIARVTGTVLGKTGIARLLGPRGYAATMRMTSVRGDQAPKGYVRAVYGQGHVLGTLLEEDTEYRQMAADLIVLRTHRTFPDVPLRVITALGDMHGEGARAWERGHAVLAKMSQRGAHVVLHDSRHMVQTDRPDVIAAAVTGMAPS